MQPIVRFVIGEDSGVLGDHVGELLILEGEIAFGSIDDDAASVELREDRVSGDFSVRFTVVVDVDGSLVDV